MKKTIFLPSLRHDGHHMVTEELLTYVEHFEDEVRGEAENRQKAGSTLIWTLGLFKVTVRDLEDGAKWKAVFRDTASLRSST